MPNSCRFVLRNNSKSSNVYAYISGIALQKNGARALMKANGKDMYYPEAPSEILQPLKEDCAILLGPPGNSVEIDVPQIAGGLYGFFTLGGLSLLNGSMKTIRKHSCTKRYILTNRRWARLVLRGWKIDLLAQSGSSTRGAVSAESFRSKCEGQLWLLRVHFEQ